MEEEKAMGELTELERAVLRIEREWWRIAATREQAIRSELGMSPSKYYIQLSRMLDCERVWKADPVLVDRLRRLRDGRLAERGMLHDAEPGTSSGFSSGMESRFGADSL
ncbi:DUF3263 domain-containing protein [Trueperella pyogenes]|uniref:DUF3263 domain-containing protein n=1 Tax=Trueperella pyogenes TaxID=1661 RepID=UPI00345D0802